MSHYDDRYDDMYAKQWAAEKARREVLLPEIIDALEIARGKLVGGVNIVRFAKRIADQIEIDLVLLRSQL